MDLDLRLRSFGGAKARNLRLTPVRALHSFAAMTTTEEMRTLLRQELAPVLARLDALQTKSDGLQAKLDGLPLISRSLTVLQQEMRALRAAFNDFARTNVTAGEIEALHADVNRVQAENAELAARLATAERLLKDLQERSAP